MKENQNNKKGNIDWSKICEECHVWPGINYDGRRICVYCWPKVIHIKNERK